MPDDGRGVFAEERQERIAEYLSVRGRARVGELTELLGVTEPTIRKDLTELERQRVLKRTHGGAILLRPVLEPALRTRDETQTDAKEEIASACLEEIADGSSIFLGSGSTIVRIARLLGDRDVNVLTNSIAVAEALARFPRIRHTVLGGQLRLDAGCFSGPVAIRALEQFTVNVAFLGVSGLSVEGISESDVGECELNAAVIDRARKVVVPADHSKVGRTDFALIAPLERVDVVVTDAVSDTLVAACEEHTIDLRVVSPRAAV